MSRKKKSKRAKPQKREMPERIPDSPENIMRALVGASPKKVTDWKYLKAEPLSYYNNRSERNSHRLGSAMLPLLVVARLVTGVYNSPSKALRTRMEGPSDLGV